MVLKRKTIDEEPLPESQAVGSKGYGALRMVNHNSIFERLEEWAEDANALYTEQIYPPDKHESYGNPRFEQQMFDGDAKLNNMIQDLSGWPKDWAPTEVQLKMHNTAFMMEAPLIFGKQFYLNMRLILEKYGWKKMLAMLISITPRKFGKTYLLHAFFFKKRLSKISSIYRFFLGQHATVHLMNIPHHQIACISKTLRQAILIIGITKKVFRMHKRAGEFRLLVNRATKIVVVSQIGGDEREMEAYPGNPDVCQNCFFITLLGAGEPPILALSLFLSLSLSFVLSQFLSTTNRPEWLQESERQAHIVHLPLSVVALSCLV